MKENTQKQVYLAPAVQVNFVAVENGFNVSYGQIETIDGQQNINF